MSKAFTLDDVVDMLKNRQGDRTLTALAAEIGVSKAYVSDIYKGRRNPGPTVLEFLGLVAVIPDTYYRKAS